MKKKSKDTNKPDPYLIDDENPEWTDEMFRNAELAHIALPKLFGKKNAELLMSGKVGRPVAESPKKQITLRLDAEIIEKFRSHGRGWQSEINAALRS